MVFDSALGRVYDVLYREDLVGAGDWALLSGDLVGTRGLIECEDPGFGAQRFYRVRVSLP